MYFPGLPPSQRWKPSPEISAVIWTAFESSETKQSGLNQSLEGEKKSINLVIIKITRPAWSSQFKTAKTPIM